MRLIHTSDWHVGKVFAFAGDSVMALLQKARLDAIDRIGRLAMAENARTVLVAGDIYDKESPDARTLAAPLEVMRRFPLVNWHLIPGNHDPDRPNGLWHRLCTLGLPEHVYVHREKTPISLDDRLWLLPAPLTQRHNHGDPTAWMEKASTPEGCQRIGLAHGSIAEFGMSAPTPNHIAPDRAKTAGLSYLALGDWHGAKSINAQTWYAGTPEPDSFDQEEGGQTLIVDLTDGKLEVKTHPTATYRWLKEKAALQTAEDIQRLEQRVRSTAIDLSSLLLRLKVEGMLSLADHALFDRIIAETGLGAALCLLDLDRNSLIVQPSEDELDHLTSDPVVKETIRRLRAKAESADNLERKAASRAIQHLQLACHRRRQEAAA